MSRDSAPALEPVVGSNDASRIPKRPRSPEESDQRDSMGGSNGGPGGSQGGGGGGGGPVRLNPAASIRPHESENNYYMQMHPLNQHQYPSHPTAQHAPPPPPPPSAAYDGQHVNGGPPPPPHQSYQMGYGPGSVSPSPRHSIASPGPPAVGAGGQLPGGQTKRPYRQRRKDPSCDACRERKVKCDATETASCNECKSRGVKCQFTKETNRRMSSIKQVQDLEKQLAAAKRTIAEYMDNGGNPNFLAAKSKQDSPNMPEIGAIPCKRPRAPPVADEELTGVRSHIRDFSRGVFKPPPPYRPIACQPHFLHPSFPLPEVHVGEALLSSYYQAIHNTIPILHWPQFVQAYDSIKHKKDTEGIAPEWGSVLFAVFACGILYNTDPNIRMLYPLNGKEYINVSRQLTDLFNDEFSIEHVQSALLTSVFLCELNCKSAGWTWLGVTVRIAQDIGLHRDSGPWPVVEGEMRRRVWWGIYAWDRLLSVELGRVLLIEDKDCDIDLPCALDDHFIQDTGVFQQNHAPSQLLLTTIHVVRLIPSLLERTLQSTSVSPETLRLFDSFFDTCQNMFPQPLQIYQPEPLEPRHLSPILHLQNLRIVLHRHNLSTSCATDVRTAAIRSCTSAAKNTVLVLRRLQQYRPLDNHQTWAHAVQASASTMICTHIWRCILFLLFEGQYDDALVCIEVSAAIGDFREVNIGCGRNIYGFLLQLTEKLAHGVELIRDEMMIALVSGDVQGSTESSWAWDGSETGSVLNAAASPKRPGSFSPNLNSNVKGTESPNVPGKIHGRQTLSVEERMDWKGWGNIIDMVKKLQMDGNRGQGQPQQQQGNWGQAPQQQQQPQQLQPQQQQQPQQHHQHPQQHQPLHLQPQHQLQQHHQPPPSMMWESQPPPVMIQPAQDQRQTLPPMQTSNMGIPPQQSLPPPPPPVQQSPSISAPASDSSRIAIANII